MLYSTVYPFENIVYFLIKHLFFRILLTQTIYYIYSIGG